MNPLTSGKFRWIAGGLLLIVLAAWLAVFMSREPRYQGRSAHYWVKQTVRDWPNARRALLELGPSAVPALATAVEQKRSPVNPILSSLRPRLPKFIARRIPAPLEAVIRGDRAVELLFQLGTNAAPAVPALIRDDFHRELWEFNFAHATLVKIGAAGLPQLIRVLRSPEPRERIAAARYLGLLGPDAGNAAPALARLLRDPDPLVRTAAVVALAESGPAASAALPALRTALATSDTEFRLQLVDAIWKIGRDSESTRPILVQILEDRTNPNRPKAAALLGQMGSAAAPAVPALANVLTEDFSYTRVKAEEALGQIQQSVTSLSPARP